MFSVKSSKTNNWSGCRSVKVKKLIEINSRTPTELIMQTIAMNTTFRSWPRVVLFSSYIYSIYERKLHVTQLL